MDLGSREIRGILIIAHRLVRCLQHLRGTMADRVDTRGISLSRLRKMRDSSELVGAIVLKSELLKKCQSLVLRQRARLGGVRRLKRRLGCLRRCLCRFVCKS